MRACVRACVCVRAHMLASLTVKTNATRYCMIKTCPLINDQFSVQTPFASKRQIIHKQTMAWTREQHSPAIFVRFHPYYPPPPSVTPPLPPSFDSAPKDDDVELNVLGCQTDMLERKARDKSTRSLLIVGNHINKNNSC